MYSIVDIETTGNGIKGNKITEIAIFKFDGAQVVDEFTSLVNPECEIPYFITGLTGIDSNMVRDAPTLLEIAPQILEITKDTIFVAHSVNFDYNVIKEEFRTIGISFVRKKLCTVRLSRRLIPGYTSYSLGKLCSSLNIPITDRHRARGDAHATVILFRKLLETENSETVFSSFLNARSQEATLPPSLQREVYESLPTKPGVYYFKNSKGEIIYVGKAKNIKKRVLGHFYDKATKEVQMCRETSNIDFELSGNELLALLMESAAIKHHYPKYNRAQKRNVVPYGVFTYEDRQGIMHLAFNKLSAVPRSLITFYNTTDCRLYIEQICIAYKLCPKYCHLQENVSSCSHFRVADCGGICRGKESAEAYNKRVRKAIENMASEKQTYLIKDKGRTTDEDALVLVQEGVYAGYGFVPRSAPVNSVEDILAYITPQKDNLETTRLIQTHKVKYPKSIIDFSTGMIKTV
ncbi:exonuclease domain-containing protein [uncultured Eudoraea sp.]|uniref:exonuclease domain-containing protein n=1 Tax=uncultured Eudoraea sp. TaxID=1035614 RepID=UPI00263519EA|nr:exonuclease domain-containing protein [uncultured Eudoraea sp.]